MIRQQICAVNHGVASGKPGGRLGGGSRGKSRGKGRVRGVRVKGGGVVKGDSKGGLTLHMEV